MNGSDVAQVVSGFVAFLGVGVGLLAYFKYKPGQRENVEMTVAQANLNIAQGTVQLSQIVNDELESQFRRMSAEMTQIRDDFRQYREDTDKRLAELSIELRAEKAEKAEVKRENDQLRERVGELEREVASLKSAGR